MHLRNTITWKALKDADAAKHIERLKRSSNDEIVALGAAITDDYAITYFKISNQLSPSQQLTLITSIFKNSELSQRLKIHLYEDYIKKLQESDSEIKAELLYLITININDPPIEIAKFNAACEQFDGTDQINFYEFYKKANKKISELAQQEAAARQKRAPLQRNQGVKNLSALVSPFPKLKRAGDKSGGANVGGKHTGLYSGDTVVNIGTTDEREEVRLSLIKQDYKKDKLRINKIIGECVGGSVLRRIYHDHLGAKYDQFAEVRLIRDDTGSETGSKPDETGEHVYLQSIYIKNYKHDLWKYAYYKLFKNENIQRIKNDGLNKNDVEKLGHEIIDRMQRIEARYKKRGGFGWRKQLESDAHYLTYQNIYKALKDSSPEELKVKINSDQKIRKKCAGMLAKLAADEMKRPSGVRRGIFEPEVRSVINDLIRNNDQLLQDFATMAAPRLLIGDFGLHNGNFGLARIDGVVRLVSLDYGAAFLNPISDVNPYTTTHTGIEGIDSLYKNHFLEYGPEVNASVYMAKTYIKLGQISDDELRKYATEIMNSEIKDNLGIKPLKEFCKRLKMDKVIYENINDKEKILTFIREFLITRLSVRKISLQNIGYGLLLEHCFKTKNKSEIIDALKTALQENPGFAHYMRSDAFKQYQPILSTTPKTFKNDAISLAKPQVTAPRSSAAPSAGAPTIAPEASVQSSASRQAPEENVVVAGTAAAKQITIENASELFSLKGDNEKSKKSGHHAEKDEDEVKVVEKHLSKLQSMYDAMRSAYDVLRSFASNHQNERFMRLIEILSKLDSNIQKTTVIDFDDYLTELLQDINTDADSLLELKNIMSHINETFETLFNSLREHTNSMSTLYSRISDTNKGNGKPKLKVDELLEKLKSLNEDTQGGESRKAIIADIRDRIKSIKIDKEFKSAIEIYIHFKERETHFPTIDANFIHEVNMICDGKIQEGDNQDISPLFKHGSAILKLAKLKNIVNTKRDENTKTISQIQEYKATAITLIDFNSEIDFDYYKNRIAEIQTQAGRSTSAFDNLKLTKELTDLYSHLIKQQEMIDTSIKKTKETIILLRTALPNCTDADQANINDLIDQLDQKQDALKEQLERDKQSVSDQLQAISDAANTVFEPVKNELILLRHKLKTISDAIAEQDAKREKTSLDRDSAAIALSDQFDFAKLHQQFEQLLQIVEPNLKLLNALNEEKSLNDDAKNPIRNIIFLQNDIKSMLTYKSIGKSLPTRIIDESFNQFSLIEKALVANKGDPSLLAQHTAMINHVANDLAAWSLSLPASVDNVRSDEAIDASLALQQFVKEQIFGYQDITARTQALDRWINILKACEENRDYHSVTAIVTALESPEIKRLEFTWLGLPDDTLNYWRELSSNRLKSLPVDIIRDAGARSQPSSPSILQLALKKALIPDATLLYYSKNTEAANIFIAPTTHFKPIPELKVIIFNEMIAKYLASIAPQYLPEKIPSPDELNRLSLPHEINRDALIKAFAKIKVKKSAGNADEAIEIISSLIEPITPDSLMTGLEKIGVKITKENAAELLQNTAIFPDLSCESLLKGLASPHEIYAIDAENSRLRNLLRKRGLTDSNHQRDYLTLLTKIRDQQLKPIDISIILTKIRDNLAKNNPSTNELRELIANPFTRKIIITNKSLLAIYNQAIDTSMQMMADTLIQQDQQLISEIDAWECNYDSGTEPAPTISKSIKFFNQASQFVTNEITSVGSFDQVSLAIEYWIRVAGKCMNHPSNPNINMAIAIYSALTSSSIARLKPAFGAISPEAKDIFTRLEHIIDPGANRKNYREYLIEEPNTIPYVGVFLTDSTFFREGNPIVEQIGFEAYASAEPFLEKLRTTFDSIRKKPRLKGASQSILEEVESMTDDSDAFYKRSLALLPRDSASSIPPPKEDTITPLFAAKKTATKTTEKAAPITVDATPTAPTEVKRTLIILNKHNAELMPLLKELIPNVTVVYHQEEGDAPVANLDITLKTTAAQIDQAVNNIRESLLPSSDNEEINTQRKIELFYLVKYGHFTTHDLTHLSAKGREKLLREISKPDFFDTYFERLKPIIRNRCIADLAHAELPKTDLITVSINDVLHFETYCTDLFTGTRHHLLHENDITADPSNRKAYAAILFALQSPKYFTATPDQPINPKIIENRIEWLAIHLNRISNDDLAKLWVMLNKNNPETNTTWLQQLPTQIQQLITNKHQNTIAAFNHDPRLHELTPHIAKSMSGYTQTGDDKTYSAKYSVRTGDELSLRTVEVHLVHDKKSALNLTNFIAGRLMTALVGDASSPVVLTTPPSQNTDGLLLPDYSGEQIHVGFLTNQSLERFNPELKSLSQLPNNMHRVTVASFLLGDFTIDESNYLLTDTGILKSTHGQALDSLDDNLHLHRKIDKNNDFKKLPVKSRVSKEYAEQFKKISEFPAAELKQVIDASLKEAEAFYGAKQFFEFAKHVGVNVNDLREDWDKLDAKKDQEIKEQISKKIGDYLKVKLEKRQASCKQISLEISVSLCFNEKGKIINSNELKRLITENPAAFDVKKFHIRGDINRSAAHDALNAFVRTLTDAKEKRKSLADTAGMAFSGTDRLPTTGGTNVTPEARSAASAAGSAGASAPEQSAAKPALPSSSATGWQHTIPSAGLPHSTLFKAKKPDEPKQTLSLLPTEPSLSEEQSLRNMILVLDNIISQITLINKNVSSIENTVRQSRSL